MEKKLAEKYAGKWVAILNDRVLAVGDSVKEVMALVKKRGVKELPLITKVLRKDEETCILY